MKTTDITKKIAEKISGASEQVSNSVIAEIANIEIERRTKLISQSIKCVQNWGQNLVLLNVPDVITYDKDGVKQESYSEKRFNCIKDLKENIAKLTHASDEALKENNEAVFSELEKNLREHNIF